MRSSLLLSLTFLFACAGSEPASTPPAEAPPTTSTPPAAEAPAAEPPAVEAPPEGAAIKFVEPADGATVTSPVKVVMGVDGMQVQPAGALASGTGHHHIIVDGEAPAVGEVVPKDATHIHFGDGSTETSLELSPGEHTLTLQFADGMHRSYGPALSATIKVNVSAPEAAEPK